MFNKAILAPFVLECSTQFPAGCTSRFTSIAVMMIVMMIVMMMTIGVSGY